MSDDNEPGRDQWPKGGYVEGMFANVDSADAFATVLGVPRKSIPLVSPTDDPCKSKDCPFDAIDGNRGFCPAHCRTWYPLRKSRGGGLFGPDFGRGPFKRCSCDNPTCFAAGYFPSQPPIYIPRDGINTVVNTPCLFSEEKKEKIRNNEIKEVYLYPWHFFAEHLRREEDGAWSLAFDKKEKDQWFYDKERQKRYNFPPPRNVPGKFIEEVFYSSFTRPQDRWSQDNRETEMPSWMLNMLAIDGASFTSCKGKGQLKRELEMWKARAFYLEKQKRQQQERHQVELDETKSALESLVAKRDAEIKQLKAEIAEREEERKDLKKELASTNESLLEYCQSQKARPLRYSDLYDGGILSKHVKAFTLFDTVEQNDAFLDILNFADGSEGSFPAGDGLLENMRSYSKVPRKERSGEIAPPCWDPASPRYIDWLRRSIAHRKENGMTWKDDYLAWCLYVRAGLTQQGAFSLCGIEAGRMSDVFHMWAVALDQGLCEWFPRPTRSQMLQAYPTRFIEADGHARCFLLLDAFEIFTQTSSNPNVASSTHSDYKKHCTTKFLGGTDPIGCPWNGTIPDGYPGKASDVLATDDSKVLRQVPFGHTAKVDKGFLVDDIAVAEGVVIDRPQKRLKKQVQQSSVDTAQTQKIGNTRIIVENVNGELKLQVRMLNVLIPCLQFSVISKIVRIGYLIQNFKKAIIQDINPGDEKPEGGRPCRAEIRWYGATDAGLRDVRDNVHLWGLNCEIERHAYLSRAHPNKSAVEISEMVLAEGWDLKKRRELYQSVHGVEYDAEL